MWGASSKVNVALISLNSLILEKPSRDLASMGRAPTAVTVGEYIAPARVHTHTYTHTHTHTVSLTHWLKLSNHVSKLFLMPVLDWLLQPISKFLSDLFWMIFEKISNQEYFFSAQLRSTYAFSPRCTGGGYCWSGCLSSLVEAVFPHWQVLYDKSSIKY